jgi:hypothetical protein
MAAMSGKLSAMGQQVYGGAEKVKGSNKVF